MGWVGSHEMDPWTTLSSCAAKLFIRRFSRFWPTLNRIKSRDESYFNCITINGPTLEYCDDHVCVCMCMRVCPRPYHQNFTSNRHQVFVRVSYGCDSVLLWPHWDVLCTRTSGFMTDIIIILIIIIARSRRGPSRRCTTMSTVDSTPPAGRMESLRSWSNHLFRGRPGG